MLLGASLQLAVRSAAILWSGVVLCRYGDMIAEKTGAGGDRRDLHPRRCDAAPGRLTERPRSICHRAGRSRGAPESPADPAEASRVLAGHHDRNQHLETIYGLAASGTSPLESCSITVVDGSRRPCRAITGGDGPREQLDFTPGSMAVSSRHRAKGAAIFVAGYWLVGPPADDSEAPDVPPAEVTVADDLRRGAPAAGSRERDPLLDLWRGFCLIDVVLVHLAFNGIGLPEPIDSFIKGDSRSATQET